MLLSEDLSFTVAVTPLTDMLNLAHYFELAGYAIAVGSAINLVLTLLWGLRWRSGLRRLGLQVSYARALEAIASSFPIGVFLPGNKASQEAFRIAYLSVPNEHRAKVISATTLEWVSEGVVLGAFVLGFLVFRYARYLTLLPASLYLVELQESGVSAKARKALSDFIGGLKALASDREMLVIYIGVSVAILALDIFKVGYMLEVLGFSLSLAELIALYVALRLSSLAPTPAGAGVFDLTVIAVLTAMGCPAEISTVYLVAIRVVDTLLPAGVGAAVLAASGGLRILEAARRRRVGKP